MPCPQFDVPLQEVVDASIAYDWWRDTPSAHLSTKERSLGRARAKTVCDGKDYLLNIHIRECAVCQAAAQQPTYNSTASHHF